MGNLAKIRRRILEKRGVQLDKFTRTPLPYHETDSEFGKTPLMRFLELKFSIRIEKLLSEGTIYEAAKRLGIDATTVSKWRKRIREAGVTVGTANKTIRRESNVRL